MSDGFGIERLLGIVGGSSLGVGVGQPHVGIDGGLLACLVCQLKQ